MTFAVGARVVVTSIGTWPGRVTALRPTTIMKGPRSKPSERITVALDSGQIWTGIADDVRLESLTVAANESKSEASSPQR